MQKGKAELRPALQHTCVMAIRQAYAHLLAAGTPALTTYVRDPSRDRPNTAPLHGPQSDPSSLSPPPRRHQPHRVPRCGPQAPSPSSTAIARSDKDDEMLRIPISSTALLVRRRCLIFITSTSLPPGPAPPASTQQQQHPGARPRSSQRRTPSTEMGSASARKCGRQCSAAEGRSRRKIGTRGGAGARGGCLESHSRYSFARYGVEGGKGVDRATNDSHAGAASDADQAPSDRPPSVSPLRCWLAGRVVCGLHAGTGQDTVRTHRPVLGVEGQNCRGSYALPVERVDATPSPFPFCAHPPVWTLSQMRFQIPVLHL